MMDEYDKYIESDDFKSLPYIKQMRILYPNDPRYFYEDMEDVEENN